jgi:hypothetical protein
MRCSHDSSLWKMGQCSRSNSTWKWPCSRWSTGGQRDLPLLLQNARVKGCGRAEGAQTMHEQRARHRQDARRLDHAPCTTATSAGSSFGLGAGPRRLPGTRACSGTATCASSAPCRAQSPLSGSRWATSRTLGMRWRGSGSLCLQNSRTECDIQQTFRQEALGVRHGA